MSQVDMNTNANAFIGNGVGVGVGVGAGVGPGVGNNTTGVDNNNRTLNKNLNIGNNNQSNTTPNHNNISSNNSVNMQRAADVVKRKKLKSRSVNVTQQSSYSKDHLDAWLETCLKDASNTQLSSSSEFLDYNPTTTNNKIITAQQPQQLQQQTSQPQQQQQQLQQQQTPLHQAYPLNNHQQHFSQTQPQASQSQQQQQQQQLTPPVQQQQQQQQQQPFSMRNSTQHPLSTQSSVYNAPFNHFLQRGGMPNHMRHSNSYNNRYSMLFPSVSGNVFYQQHDSSQDFASLPPIVNMLGGGVGSSELDNNSTDVLDGSSSNPNISRGFNFSDPCLLNPSDNDSKISGQNTPDRRNNVPSEMENNKFYMTLMEQINLLHETNSKICRNLHETKVDIEALKHAPTWGLRHRRDSLSGLSTHSQPMVFGGGFGTHSPAPTYHSGAYTPGMMTDVVREVKEAARVREDALLNRVKAMVEERQWSMNESNLRMMRDIEELKSQIHHLRVDRKETNKRLTHLESENKYMRQMLATIFTNNNNNNNSSSSNIRAPPPDVIYENEALRTRKGFPNARRSQSLNIHYGTIHHQPANAGTALLLEEHNEPLHIVETPGGNANNNFGVTTASQQQQQHGSSDMRSSFSSSDGGGGGGGGGGVEVAETSNVLANGGNNSNSPGQILSPPSFALVSPPAEEVKRRKDRLGKQQKIAEDEKSQTATHELQQELNEAVAARKEADDRIIALEKLVRQLQVHADSSDSIANGVGRIHSLDDTVSNKINSKQHLSNQFSTQTQKQQQFHQWQKQPTNNFQGISYEQQQQQQQQPNTLNLSPNKLSVAGPITDL